MHIQRCLLLQPNLIRKGLQSKLLREHKATVRVAYRAQPDNEGQVVPGRSLM